jgi:cytochrome d ubiquinol oxidase subunit II
MLPAVVALSIASLAATLSVRPDLLHNYRAFPAGWLVPAATIGSLAGVVHFWHRRNDRAAFLASSAFIVFMLCGAAFALYPTLLPTTTTESNSLTIYNAAAGPRSLVIGLFWWVPGMLLATGYFVLVYRLFPGKVSTSASEHGHY